MMGKERALEVLDSAISRVKADAAEALLYAGSEALTRFANNGIHQNVSEENALIHVRAILGRRQGAATTNRLDARSLARAAKAAIELARRSPEDPEFPGLPEPGDSPGIDCLDPAAAGCSPE